MTSNQIDRESKAAVEVRVGGLHLTIQRIPYGLLVVAASVISTLGGSAWLAR